MSLPPPPATNHETQLVKVKKMRHRRLKAVTEKDSKLKIEQPSTNYCKNQNKCLSFKEEKAKILLQTENFSPSHLVDWIPFKPCSVDALASKKNVLAVLRKDDKVTRLEWRQIDRRVFKKFTQHLPLLSTAIAMEDGGQTECMAWIDDDHFLTAAYESLSWWNWRGGYIERRWIIDAPPVAMVFCEHLSTLFIAHSDRIRPYQCSLIDGSVQVVPGRPFDPFESKVMSMSLVGNDKLVTGLAKDGKVQVWDAQKGNSQGFIEFGTERTRIHCMCPLGSDLVAVGDSKGHVTIIDCAMMVPVQSIRTHSAPILCIVAGLDGMLFASGVDHRTVQILKEGSKWTMAATHSFHTHDVLAMTYVGGKDPLLISGGLDGNLIVVEIKNFQSVGKCLEGKKTTAPIQGRIPDLPIDGNCTVKTPKRCPLPLFIAKSNEGLDVWIGKKLTVKLSFDNCLADFACWWEQGILHVLCCFANGLVKQYNVCALDTQAPSVKILTFPEISDAKALKVAPNTIFCIAKSDKKPFIYNVTSKQISPAANLRLLGEHAYVDSQKRVRFASGKAISLVNFVAQPTSFDCNADRSKVVIGFADGSVRMFVLENCVLKDVLHKGSEPCLEVRFVDEETFAVRTPNKALLVNSVDGAYSVASQDPGIRPILHFDGSCLVWRSWADIIDALPSAFYRRKYGAG